MESVGFPFNNLDFVIHPFNFTIVNGIIAVIKDTIGECEYCGFVFEDQKKESAAPVHSQEQTDYEPKKSSGPKMFLS